MTNIANTLQEAVPMIDSLTLDRWAKRAIYNDLRYGYTFGAANEQALLNSRKRKFPTYTYYLPDGQSFHCAGELLHDMVKNARQRIRAVRQRNDDSAVVGAQREVIRKGNQLANDAMGDPVPGRLAAYGFVDYLDGGVSAMRGSSGGGAVAQASQRPEPAAPQQSNRDGDDTHDQSAPAVAVAGGDTQDPAPSGIQVQCRATGVVDMEERRERSGRRRRR